MNEKEFEELIKQRNRIREKIYIKLHLINFNI